MRKIIFFLILMILSPKLILASDVIYSDFSDYTEYTENYIKSSDLIDVKTENRFLWYKNILKDNGYKVFNQTDTFDLNDCYFGEYSEWEKEKVENSSRVYERRVVHDFIMSNPVRYIHITNIHGSDGKLKIPEFEIQVVNNKINYTYTCEGCSNDFGTYINNGVIYEDNSYISNGGSIIIDLKNAYPANRVMLLYYLLDLGDDVKGYTISYSTDGVNLYGTKEFIYNEKWSSVFEVRQTIEDFGIDLKNWTYEKTDYMYPDISPGYEFQDVTFIVYNTSYIEYRYKEKYCKNLINDKEYGSIYSASSYDEFNIKDDDSKKTYYSYRTRDKLELKDKLLVNSYNYDLSDFVIYSSKDYDIQSNLDINKNGIYDITFSSGDITANRKVEVDINKDTIEFINKINELENKLKELEELHEKDMLQKEELIKKLEEKISECSNCDSKYINDILKEKDELINKYLNEVKKNTKNIENLKNQIKDLKKNISELKKDITKLNKEIDKILKTIIDLKNSITNEEKEIKNLKTEITKIEDKLDKVNNKYNTVVNDYKSEIKNIDDSYKNKIQELEKQIKLLIQNSETNERESTYYKQELEKLKNDINDSEDLKEEYDLSASKIENLESLNSDLNERLNNYMLKINGTEKMNLLWLYILILFLFTIYMIYKIKKRSTEK